MRWFVELDDAIQVRRIKDDAMKVTFAMSNLAGRAKDWALGLKLHDSYAVEYRVVNQDLTDGPPLRTEVA